LDDFDSSQFIPFELTQVEVKDFEDDFEPSQPIPFEVNQDELERKRIREILWRLNKLPAEIKQGILTMAYGSPIWSFFAARRWKERLSFLSGDLITCSITDIKLWERGQQTEFNFTESKLTRDVITIAIDNLGIRSLKVSNSWPFASSHQARSNDAYIVEQISNLDNLNLEIKVFNFIVCLFTRLIAN
jgi:hypothetical protein